MFPVTWGQMVANYQISNSNAMYDKQALLGVIYGKS